MVAAPAGAAALLASTRAFKAPQPVMPRCDAAGLAEDFCGALGLCAQALPSIIDALRARGFELVAVSELLGSS
jgi:hypothetical protein